MAKKNNTQDTSKDKDKPKPKLGFISALIKAASENLAKAQGPLKEQETNYESHLDAYQTLLRLAAGDKLGVEERSVLGPSKFTDGSDYSGIASLLVDVHRYRSKADKYSSVQNRLREVRSKRDELSDKCKEAEAGLAKSVRSSEKASHRYNSRGEELKKARAEARKYQEYQASEKYWDKLNSDPYTRLQAAVKSDRAYTSLLEDSKRNGAPTTATYKIQDAIEIGRFIVAIGKMLIPYTRNKSTKS